MKFEITYTECPYASDSFRSDVRDIINDLEEKHPGSKHAIVNSFLEILSFLKERYRDSDFGRCEVCGEPSAKAVCNSCDLKERLELANPGSRKAKSLSDSRNPGLRAKRGSPSVRKAAKRKRKSGGIL